MSRDIALKELDALIDHDVRNVHVRENTERGRNRGVNAIHGDADIVLCRNAENPSAVREERKKKKI